MKSSLFLLLLATSRVPTSLASPADNSLGAFTVNCIRSPHLIPNFECDRAVDDLFSRIHGYPSYGISGWTPRLPWPGLGAIKAPLATRSGSCTFTLTLERLRWPYMALVTAVQLDRMSEELSERCWEGKPESGGGTIRVQFEPILGFRGTDVIMEMAPNRAAGEESIDENRENENMIVPTAVTE